MDIIQRLLEVFAGFVWMLIDGMTQLILGVAGSMVDITEAEAQTMAIAFWVLVFFAWFARRTLWRSSFGMFRPMTITLTTSRTPWQVMMEDMRGCFVTLIAIVVFVAVLYAVASGR